jgi:alkanesulfonate monooxygenase SsuD/methylene tetrahydromethanopterin reductase-like flavin-dependent oxidoreductase (luciferase family)
MNAIAPSFGLTLPQRGVLFGVGTVGDLLAMARDADSSGAFDAIWVGDSLLAKPRPDSIALLGALAGATSRVRLGVGCMSSFPIRDPITFACQWATLDLLSQGRMRLAVCTGLVGGGASAGEGAHWGVADRERAARMEENIEICRRLWGGDHASFGGRYHSFSDVTLAPRPLQQPCPIWIAANPSNPKFVDRAMQRIARLADGWMSVQMFPGMFARLWSKLGENLRAEGRDAGAFPALAYHNININEDRAAALEESKRFLDKYYGREFTPEMVQTWTAAGSPEECVAHLRELRQAGAKSITLRITSWRQSAQYRRLLNEVLPRLGGS